jgi:sodium/potassium/calcium exchanger 6
MGYPVMAISACYGGPLLNILLGVGVSGTYFIAKFGQPYYIDFDVTLITTCTALLILLSELFLQANIST